MWKIFCTLILVVFLESCKSGGDCFWCNLYQEEASLAEGRVVDHETESLYEVTGADSLTSIARRYGTTSSNLISMNNLKKPYILRPGMLIKVPTIRTEEEQSEINAEKDSVTKEPKIVEIKPSRKIK